MRCHNKRSELAADLLQRGCGAHTQKAIVVLLPRRSMRSLRRRSSWRWPGTETSSIWSNIYDFVIVVIILRHESRCRPILPPCVSWLSVRADDSLPLLLAIEQVQLLLRQDWLRDDAFDLGQCGVEVFLLIGHPVVDHLVDLLPDVVPAKLELPARGKGQGVVREAQHLQTLLHAVVGAADHGADGLLARIMAWSPGVCCWCWCCCGRWRGLQAPAEGQALASRLVRLLPGERLRSWSLRLRGGGVTKGITAGAPHGSPRGFLLRPGDGGLPCLLSFIRFPPHLVLCRLPSRICHGLLAPREAVEVLCLWLPRRFQAR
mmetsp:Transcript_20322/g.48204  ORF Transcript_20322/g.48204 Transcript_20322/m.48204 type:complete len:318 (-) Transcript_20322:40-993(-)